MKLKNLLACAIVMIFVSGCVTLQPKKLPQSGAIFIRDRDGAEVGRVWVDESENLKFRGDLQRSASIFIVVISSGRNSGN